MWIVSCIKCEKTGQFFPLTERVQKDFSYIEEKSKALKNCSKINEFDQTFDFQAFKEQNSSLEEVKTLFDKLQKWENQNSKIANEQKKGLFTASGRKLRENLQKCIKREQDNLRNLLHDMATQTDREINKQIAQMKEDLKREPANLTNYVDFVNKLQSSKKLFDELSDKKKKLEEMKAVLGKYRVKDENAFTNQTKISNLQAKIDVLTDLLAETEEDIKKADERAKAGKEQNMESPDFLD